MIVILVLIVLFILVLNQEPHFKITKEGVDVNEIEYMEDYMIQKRNLSVGWLNKNCEPKQNIEDNTNTYKCIGYVVEVWNQIR